MQRRYLPPHKVAQLADPSAKQTRIAYRHLFSFSPGLLLSLISSLFFAIVFFSFAILFFFCLCVVRRAAFCALFFREGFFFMFFQFAAQDCHSNGDFASWHSGALLCLNRYFRHLRMWAWLRRVVKSVFPYLASPLKVLFLQHVRCLLMCRLSKTFLKEPLKSNNQAFFSLQGVILLFWQHCRGCIVSCCVFLWKNYHGNQQTWDAVVELGASSC